MLIKTCQIFYDWIYRTCWWVKFCSNVWFSAKSASAASALDLMDSSLYRSLSAVILRSSDEIVVGLASLCLTAPAISLSDFNGVWIMAMTNATAFNHLLSLENRIHHWLRKSSQLFISAHPSGVFRFVLIWSWTKIHSKSKFETTFHDLPLLSLTRIECVFSSNWCISQTLYVAQLFQSISSHHPGREINLYNV